MLSLSKHLAEANPKHNQPVSTRFLDYARNDRVGVMVKQKNRKRAYKPINGTYVKVFCHVEQAKRVETSRGSDD